jgi:hypothetical protein
MARTEGSIHVQGLSDMQAHFPSEGLFPTVLLLCHVVSSDRQAPCLIVAKAVTNNYWSSQGGVHTMVLVSYCVDSIGCRHRTAMLRVLEVPGSNLGSVTEDSD